MPAWTIVADEVAAAWNFVWNSLQWHMWENETTDDWEDWG